MVADMLRPCVVRVETVAVEGGVDFMSSVIDSVVGRR